MRGDNLTLRHKYTKSYDPCLEGDRRLQQRPVHNLSEKLERYQAPVPGMKRGDVGLGSPVGANKEIELGVICHVGKQIRYYKRACAERDKRP